MHIAIILPSPWQQPCFSIGWQRSLPVPSSVLISCTTKLLCYPITLTTAGGDDSRDDGGLGSEEVLFTNCNFRFLFVWSSRAFLFMTDVELCSRTFTYDLFFPKFPFKPYVGIKNMINEFENKLSLC